MHDAQSEFFENQRAFAEAQNNEIVYFNGENVRYGDLTLAEKKEYQDQKEEDTIMDELAEVNSKLTQIT